MKVRTQLLAFLIMGLQMNAMFGFSSGSCTITRHFDATSAVTNTAIHVSVLLTNGDAAVLRGFCFVDQIPYGLSVNPVAVTLNGRNVSNYTFDYGALGDVYPGRIPYRWILEEPTAFSENNGIAPNAVIQIDYTLTAARPGSFILDNFSWSGFDPIAPNASFGSSENADAQVLNFVTAPPPPYPLLVLSSSLFNFYSGQGSVTAPQGLAIMNWGTGTLNWNATAPTNTPTWLLINPPSGSQDTNVMVSAASASLPPGTYTNTLVITAAGAANSPQVVTAILTINPSIPTQGLAGYWAFDEGAGTAVTDASGNGHPLSLVNGPTWTNGQLNTALFFNGINNFAVVPSLDLRAATAVSIAFWLKRSYSANQSAVVLESSPDFNSSATGFMLFPDTPNGMAVGLHGNVGYNLKYFSQPNNGIWHHFVLIYDKSKAAAGEVTLFIDGTLQTVLSQPYSADNTNPFGNDPFYLFSRAGTQLFGSGTIDELRIYSRALSAAEITNLYLQPYLQIRSANPGVKSNRFRFSVSANSDLNVVVEACTNLVQPVWTPLATNSVSALAPCFLDPRWTNFGSRFYRIRSP